MEWWSPLDHSLDYMGILHSSSLECGSPGPEQETEHEEQRRTGNYAASRSFVAPFRTLCSFVPWPAAVLQRQ
jgi:hypothetical protein